MRRWIVEPLVVLADGWLTLWITPCLTLCLFGCGGPPAPPTEQAPRGRTARASDCPHHQTRLGSACWDATGTRWRVEAQGPGGTYRFELELMAAGRARSTDHAAAGPAHDEWFQEDRLLRVFLSDRFVEYRTQLTNGTVLIGEATNVRGQRWSWRGDRVFTPSECGAAETRVAEACMTLAGTRWRLEAEGMEATEVEFLDRGRVGQVGRAYEESTGTWTQAGASVRFELSAGSRAYVAEITNEEQLVGTWTAPTEDGQAVDTANATESGAWSAARVESIAPVIHR